MPPAHKILVVDDEPQIRALLRATLTRAGYAVVEAASGRGALTARDIDRPNLILLDLGLPDRDGLELVGPLRDGAGGARLIVVSAREDIGQKVAALDLGADDYVTKPFDTDELLARIRASLRQQFAAEAERQVVTFGEIRIDLLRRTITRRGAEVRVTPKEYAVLAELAKSPGRVLTHAHLLRTAWGPAQEKQTEYLRVIMRSLRQKLEPDSSRPSTSRTTRASATACGRRRPIDTSEAEHSDSPQPAVVIAKAPGARRRSRFRAPRRIRWSGARSPEPGSDISASVSWRTSAAPRRRSSSTPLLCSTGPPPSTARSSSTRSGPPGGAIRDGQPSFR